MTYDYLYSGQVKLVVGKIHEIVTLTFVMALISLVLMLIILWPLTLYILQHDHYYGL